MKRATIYIAATLLATGAVATYATTPSAETTEQVREMQVAPYAGMSDSKQVLLFLSQAERLVSKGDDTFAKMHLNEAMSAAARLPASPQASDHIHRVTLVTLRDGTLERQLMLMQPANITEPLSFSPEALPVDKKTITKAEVVYIQPAWNKADVLVGLNKAMRAIETGKSNAVTPEFNKLHELLITDNKHNVSERRAAQDNVALARMLLQAGAYDAAKQALANADTHISNVAENNDASPKRFEEIATMRNEMADVSKVIERNDPSAFKTLDAKLEKWWNALS